jgi:hypothetical protein
MYRQKRMTDRTGFGYVEQITLIGSEEQ